MFVENVKGMLPHIPGDDELPDATPQPPKFISSPHEVAKPKMVSIGELAANRTDAPQQPDDNSKK